MGTARLGPARLGPGMGDSGLALETGVSLLGLFLTLEPFSGLFPTLLGVSDVTFSDSIELLLLSSLLNDMAEAGSGSGGTFLGFCGDFLGVVRDDDGGAGV